MQTPKNIVTVLTLESADEIIERGATELWYANEKNIREPRHVVIERNRRKQGAEVPRGPEPHRQAFLIGHISKIETPRKSRHRIHIDRYARVAVNIGQYSDGSNPLHYFAALSDLGIDENTLTWKAINPEAVKAPPSPIEKARLDIATFYGVAPEAVQINVNF